MSYIVQTKTSLGLSNVDNTDDASKPVSTAQQSALDAKANAPYKSYQARISQSGTSAPSATVYNTDFGAVTFTWARTSTGVYTVTTNSAVLTANKTHFSVQPSSGAPFNVCGFVTSTTVVSFTTSQLTAGVYLAGDDVFSKQLIEIRVYN